MFPKLVIGLASVLLFTACSIILGFSNNSPGVGKTVRMGQATWDTGWFQAQVIGQYSQLVDSH